MTLFRAFFFSGIECVFPAAPGTVVAYLLPLYLAYLLGFDLAYLLALFLAFLLAVESLGARPGTISHHYGVSSGVLSGANAGMSQGSARDILKHMGGVQCAVARHNRSVHPIDAIWASGGLLTSHASEIEGDGDLSIAQCSFQMTFQKCNAPPNGDFARSETHSSSPSCFNF